MVQKDTKNAYENICSFFTETTSCSQIFTWLMLSLDSYFSAPLHFTYFCLLWSWLPPLWPNGISTALLNILVCYIFIRIELNLNLKLSQCSDRLCWLLIITVMYSGGLLSVCIKLVSAKANDGHKIYLLVSHRQALVLMGWIWFSTFLVSAWVKLCQHLNNSMDLKIFLWE